MTAVAYISTILTTYLLGGLSGYIPLVGGLLFWYLIDLSWVKYEGGHIPILLMVFVLAYKIWHYNIAHPENFRSDTVKLNSFAVGALATEIIGLFLFIIISFFAFSPTRWI